MDYTDTPTATTPASRETHAELRLHVIRQVHPAPPDGAPPWMAVLGRAPLVVGRRPGPDGVRFQSDQISRRHARLAWSARFDCYVLEDLDSHNGTFVNGARISETRLVNGSRIRIGDHLLLYTNFTFPRGAQPDRLAAEVSLARACVEMMADRAAPMDLPVLIVGPTGAGKERLARRVHERSGRAGAFVAINCATLDRNLVGSRLFGHRRGAFTGASADRPGLFVAADKGTLLLDEVGELPLDIQPQLLRVLQEGRLTPVGSDRERAVDVRVVAATLRDLDAMVAAGTFRADLLARLRGVTLTLPGLSDRRAEILPLLRGFLGARPLSVTAAEVLLAHDWPDNVRGLQAVVNHLRVRGGEGPVAVADLPKRLVERTASVRSGGRPTYDTLHALLVEHAGNVTRVGAALGVARQQVHRWAQACDLDIKSFRK